MAQDETKTKTKTNPSRTNLSTIIDEMPPDTSWASGMLPAEFLERTKKNAATFSHNTVKNLLPLWATNLGQNFEKVRDGLNMGELHDSAHGMPAIVLGAGPSVNKYRQLATLKKWNGVTLCSDRMLIPALKAGLSPTMVLSVDGNPIVAKFYQDPLCEQSKHRVVAGMNAMNISPETLEACPYEVYWFLSAMDDPRRLGSVSGYIHYMTQGKMVIQASGNVGALSWHIAHFMGCDPIGLVGMDYGYDPRTPIQKTIYWKHFKVMARDSGLKGEKARKWVRDCYKTYKVPWSGRKIRTDLMWDVYKIFFMRFIQAATCQTVNLSPQSALFGGKIQGADLKTFIQEHNPPGMDHPPIMVPDQQIIEEAYREIDDPDNILP